MNASYKEWDALGVGWGGGTSSAWILDLRPAHLHNLSAGQWEASGDGRADLHIPRGGHTLERID